MYIIILITMVEIDIAYYLKKLEDTGDPINNLISLSLNLAEDIKIGLNKIENLQTKDGHIPICDVSVNSLSASAEILVCSIAVLASAWTAWCFTAKENNPTYRNDLNNKEASKNVSIVRPYIMNLINDAMYGGKEIGKRYTNNEKTVYRTDSGPMLIKLRK